MSIAVQSHFSAVEKVVVAAQSKGLDPQIAAYYCKLGCVMICGAVERSVEVLIMDKVASKSLPQVGSFLKSFFRRGTNYDCEEIAELLYKFDTKWGHAFREFVAKNDQIKNSVASCYAIRNSVAHGGSQSLGPKILRQYFDSSFELVCELEHLLRRNHK